MPRLSSFSDTKSGFGLSASSGDVDYAGYTMVFVQNSAPTGWTQVTNSSYHDCAIRINSNETTPNVTVNAASNPFTSTFTPKPILSGVFTANVYGAQTNLTTTNLPVHSHASGGADWLNAALFPSAASVWPTYATTLTIIDPNRRRSGIAIGTSTGQPSHNHGLPGPTQAQISVNFTAPANTNFSIAYTDAILATKD